MDFAVNVSQERNCLILTVSTLTVKKDAGDCEWPNHKGCLGLEGDDCYLCDWKTSFQQEKRNSVVSPKKGFEESRSYAQDSAGRRCLLDNEGLFVCTNLLAYRQSSGPATLSSRASLSLLLPAFVEPAFSYVRSSSDAGLMRCMDSVLWHTDSLACKMAAAMLSSDNNS